MFAIVDLETTGGNSNFHNIIEIAIIIHDGQKIIDQYQTLVNPGYPIPPFITTLTGITDEMVQDAPFFEDIAANVTSILSNHIFVAHNVSFDYSFIKKALAKHDIIFNKRKICTVRLSRKLIPGLRSYSLKSLCQYLNIINKRAHRAMADTEATTKLLEHLLEVDPDMKIINGTLKRKREALLPPNVPAKIIEKLPEKIGVYYFHDQQGKIVYIGKASNLKQRVKEHLSGQTHTKSKTRFLDSIYDVSFQITGSEMLSLILENEEIKKHYPRYNKSNKKFNLNFGVYQYTDQEGYLRIIIGRAGKRDKPLHFFHTKAEATTFVLRKISKHGLCMKKCDIISEGTCHYQERFDKTCQICQEEVDIDTYNKAVTEAFNNVCDYDYIIKSPGRTTNEEGYIMVEKGRFLGFGYASNTQISDWESAKENLKSCYDTRDSQSIVKHFLKKASLISEVPVKTFSVS